MAGPRRLGAFLPNNLTHALSARTDEGLRLQQAWMAAAGEPLASHSHPARYADGLLYLHVDTPAWASRLRHQQIALAQALRRYPMLRDLKELRIRVVPPNAARFSKPVARGVSRLSPKAARVIRGSAAGVSDPDLRRALERLAERGGTEKPNS